MATLEAADRAAREQALDVRNSYIVQAPAGSGKTELLSQRYLALLATVEEPEEVLAITFTRKAAAEMRARVLKALALTEQGVRPQEAHRQKTFDLARRVVEQADRQGWNLDRQPGRLRIQTIDSLNASLAGQMPLMSRLGASPSPTDHAEQHYRSAATAVLDLVESDEHGAAVAELLRHLDNDRAKAGRLLVSMLSRRDQWLRHLSRIERKPLEDALRTAIRDELRLCEAGMPESLWPELLRLAAFSASQLRARRNETGDIGLGPGAEQLSARPGTEPESALVWRWIRDMLLTEKGDWRKTVTVKQGFPPDAKVEKKAFTELLLSLQEGGEPLREALHGLRSLPFAGYDENQWRTLSALIRCLQLAAAQLKLVFADAGEEDFPELGQRALLALDAGGTPTDLALALDYRIRHVLIDEFQDTSQSQFELLRYLTAGWEAGDGRTLFAVGDPMQSIYRFREADVGLFLAARQSGIGSVPLQPLSLRVNFRSQAGIVEWINGCFARVFPPREHVASGAVMYSPSVSSHELLAGAAVSLHAHVLGDHAAEAANVLDIVRRSWEEDSAARIAILVRSRGQLAHIVRVLTRAGQRFRATDIEPLHAQVVVRDLLSLLQALQQTGDRLAWLSVLRAPWCGLTLPELTLLAEQDGRSVLERLCDEAVVSRLSGSGQVRVRTVRAVLTRRLEQMGRTRLRAWVEGAWLELGGPACTDARGLRDAQRFLELLEAHDGGGYITDMSLLYEDMAKLYAAADTLADERLQVMTIHKSKGLEFDVVIVPGLDRKPRSDQRKLVDWLETGRGDDGLLLAPIAGSRGEGLINGYIRQREARRDQREMERLAYVAATRARKRLHLLAGMALDEEGNAKSPSGLLALMWPGLKERFPLPPQPPNAADVAPPARQPRLLGRLAADWRSPPFRAALKAATDASSDDVVDRGRLAFDWVGEGARLVGVVVHRWLQFMGNEGLAHWNRARVQAQSPAISSALRGLGLPEEELADAARQAVQALHHVIDDERGRWIFSPAHSEIRSEYALTALQEGRITRIAIDRTFVDADGNRWIVDFKTSRHSGSDIEGFLQSELERYRPQLSRYRSILSLQESRPIKAGLYFPLMKAWIEMPWLL